MKRRHRAHLAAILGLTFAHFFALPGCLTAEQIVADFDGTIYWVSDPATGVVLNDPVHGRLRYRSDAVADPDSEQQAVYQAVDELSLSILHNGVPIHYFSATGGRIVMASSPTYYAFLGRGSLGLEDDTLLGQPLEALTLNLQNDHGVPGSTTALPVELSLSNFNPALSFVDVDVNDNTWLSAYITSIRVVPEPGSLFLVASGVIACGLWRSRFGWRRAPK